MPTLKSRSPEKGDTVHSQNLHTVEKAVSCLFFLADAGPSTAQAIAEGCGLAYSTAYRYLSALKSANMVREMADRRYGLGPRCVQLESAFRSSLTEHSEYGTVMQDLAVATGETVALLAPVDDDAICIDTVESSLPLRYTFAKGVVKPMLRGASAKVMLAFMPHGRVDALLARDTTMDADAKAELRSRLPAIRSAGYAVTAEEVDAGVWAVGAPVFGADGEMEGSLSTIAPLFRAEGREAFFVRATVEAAKRIPGVLGKGRG